MYKMKRRLAVCLLVLAICLLVLALALAWPLAAAAAGTAGDLQGYEAAEGQLRVLCAAPAADAAAENFAVTLGGQNVPVLSAATASGTPRTVYCLVDVSGSMKEEQMEQARAALRAVAESLGPEDNFAIGTMGDTLAAGDFLTDPAEIAAAIDGLAATGEDTNLYAGIVESLALLQSDARVNPQRCLIILSDGEDDQKSGITQQEATRAVEDSNIPVYTVATLRQDPTAAQIENAKLLGSFARASVGGAHYAPAVDGLTAEAAGRQITTGLDAALLLTLDTSAAAPDRDVLLLRAIYTGADGATLEDTLDVYAEDLIFAAPEPAADSEPAAEPEPEPEPGTPWWIVGVAAAAVLLIAAAGYVIVKKQKKPAAPPEPAAPAVLDAMPATGPAALERAEEPPAYLLRLTALGYGQVHTLPLPEGREVTVGRDSRRAQLVLNDKDTALSGVHCKLKCEKGVLYVWDLSRNGTFVNGVPVRPMGVTTLASGQTIRMGSYEYRAALIKQ